MLSPRNSAVALTFAILLCLGIMSCQLAQAQPGQLLKPAPALPAPAVNIDLKFPKELIDLGAELKSILTNAKAELADVVNAGQNAFWGGFWIGLVSASVLFTGLLCYRSRP